MVLQEWTGYPSYFISFKISITGTAFLNAPGVCLRCSAVSKASSYVYHWVKLCNFGTSWVKFQESSKVASSSRKMVRWHQRFIWLILKFTASIASSTFSPINTCQSMNIRKAFRHQFARAWKLGLWASVWLLASLNALAFLSGPSINLSNRAG